MGVKRSSVLRNAISFGSATNCYNPNLTRSSPPGPPMLIWPSIQHPSNLKEHDSRSIPDLNHILSRHRHNRDAKANDAKVGPTLLGCSGFWEAVKSAKLLFVFDPHLSPHLIRNIRFHLNPSSRRLQILRLIGGTQDREKCIHLATELANIFQGTQTIIECRMGMESRATPFPHDRFAITDGEFWHFGGTVGGLEPCLTAVSRGWKVSDVGAEIFFNGVWDHLAPAGGEA